MIVVVVVLGNRGRINNKESADVVEDGDDDEMEEDAVDDVTGPPTLTPLLPDSSGGFGGGGGPPRCNQDWTKVGRVPPAVVVVAVTVSPAAVDVADVVVVAVCKSGLPSARTWEEATDGNSIWVVVAVAVVPNKTIKRLRRVILLLLLL